jgi:hypothetical protein
VTVGIALDVNNKEGTNITLGSQIEFGLKRRNDTIKNHDGFEKKGNYPFRPMMI